MGQLLKGEAFASPLKERIRAQVETLRRKRRLIPEVCVIQLHKDAAFDVYLAAQKKCAQGLGFKHSCVDVSGLSAARQLKRLSALNKDRGVHGIVIQMPVPDKDLYARVITTLDPVKDIEGVTPYNQGGLFSGLSVAVSPTAQAAFRMAQAAAGSLAGKEVVIVGHSALVGKPLGVLFLNELATVTVCHIGTYQREHLASHVQSAEVLCSAAGKPGLIQGSWIKTGAVVIDVGINVTPKGIQGDVDFQAAQERAASITPVPGGVGPFTTAILFENALKACLIQRRAKQ